MTPPRPIRESLRQNILARVNLVDAIRVYANLPEPLQSDLAIAERVFRFDGLALAYAPWHIRQNQFLVDIAVRNTCFARQHSPLYNLSLTEEQTFNGKRQLQARTNARFRLVVGSGAVIVDTVAI
jgi:hypothetical protein